MTEPSIQSTDIHSIPASLGPDLMVLDVREDHEWAAGHIDGAVHIPLGDLPARANELDPSVPTLVVCHLGGRSAQATAWLSQHGHDVTNVEGGMEAWEQAGRATTR